MQWKRQSIGVNPGAVGVNPEATGVNPGATGVNPKPPENSSRNTGYYVELRLLNLKNMKGKYFFLILAFIRIAYSMAQDTGEYNAFVYAKLSAGNFKDDCDGNFINITANGASNSVLWTWNNRIRNNPSTLSINKTVPLSIQSFKIDSKRQYGIYFGAGCETANGSGNRTNTVTISGPTFSSPKWDVPGWGSNADPNNYYAVYLWPQSIGVKATRPASDANSSQYSLPTEDKITLTATSGFHASTYQWQYSFSPTDESSWVSLPGAFLSSATISVCGNDIFGNNALTQVQNHKNISFRIKPPQIALPNGTTGKTVVTYITLDMVPSAPHIERTEVTDALCYGGTGSVTLFFDRDLLPDEKLTPYVNGLQYSDATTFDATTSSITVNNLAARAAKYTFELLGYYQATGYEHTTFTGGNNHKAEATVGSPPVLTASFTGQDVTCYNGYDGWIKVEAGGGSGGYKLYWKRLEDSNTTTVSMTGNNITLNNLKAGTYELYVADKNDCRVEKNGDGSDKIQQVTLTQPATGPQVTVQSTQQPSAYGESNGSAYVTVDGDDGSGYLENNYSNATYNPSKNDMGGDRYQFSFEEVLSAGSYTFYYTTSNGCKQAATFSLSQPDPFVASASVTSYIHCIGDRTGVLSVSASGGVAGQGYAYQWAKENNGYYEDIPMANASQLYNMGAGRYRITVTDNTWTAQKNVATAFATLSDPSPVTVSSINTTAVSCYDGSNGTARISVQGGWGNYTAKYKKEDGTAIMLNFGGSATYMVSNLSAGNYYIVELKDRYGCEASLPESGVKFTVLQPEAPVSATPIRIKNTSGFGRSDGLMEYRIAGGTPLAGDPPYTITWKNAKGQTVTPDNSLTDGVFTTRISDLPRELYTLTVKDRNNCTLVVSDSIREPDPLTVQLVNTATVDCYGDRTGELFADVKGGIPFEDPDKPAYCFRWYLVGGDAAGGDSLLVDELEATLPHMPTGRYRVEIADSSDPPNTIESGIFFIDQPPLLITELHTRDIACFGTNDGFIHAGVSGGVGGYRLFYKASADDDYTEHPITPGDLTFYVDNLPADTYSVYIIDANSCHAKIEGDDIHEVVLTQPEAPLGITSFRQRNVSGFGLANGTLSVTVGGGTPLDDNSYRIEWINKKGQTLTSSDYLSGNAFISMIDSLPVDTYTVKITDKHYAVATPGKDSTCFFTASYVITEPEELLTRIEETHFVSCYGMSDGQLRLHIKGGVPNPNPVPGSDSYRIAWYREGENGFAPAEDLQGTLLNGLTRGTYRVIIEDYSWEPNRDTLTWELVQPEKLTATATDMEVSCGEVVDVNVWVKGGTPPYRYEWSTGDTDSVIPDAVPGKYMVFITDSRGCQTTALAKVTAPTDMAIRETLHDPLCYQGANGHIELKVTGGRPPYSFKWNTGATTQNLTGLKAGSYNVIVSDAEKCSAYMDFILNDPEPISVSLGEDRVLCRGQKLEITPEVADPKSRYAWTGPEGFVSTKPGITADRDGVYRLTITDSNGCQATDEIRITVRDIEISSEIIVSTHVFVGDTVYVINISDPMPESVEWIVEESDSLQIIDRSEHLLRVVFHYPGVYPTGLRTFVGECFEDFVKQVSVADADMRQTDFFAESIIRSFTLYPNPNSGNFTVAVELSRVSPIRLRIVSIGTGIVMHDSRYFGQQAYAVPYSLFLATGVYAVLLETDAGYMVFKTVIQ
jgi:hypothetical protein